MLRTSPLEATEQAAARSFVYVFSVPCELLGTPKGFAANGTDSPYLGVHIMTAAALQAGALGVYMPFESASVWTSLEYFSSDKKKPGNAHLVCRQLGLMPLGHWRLNASDSCFKGRTTCRGTKQRWVNARV